MSHQLWFLAVGFFVLNGVVSHSVEGATSSNLATSLRTVSSLYSQQQWAKAAVKAQKGLASASPSKALKQRADLYMYLGASLYQMKHRALAWSAFEKALGLSAGVKLPPGADSGLKRLFAKAKKKFRPDMEKLTKPLKRPKPAPVQSDRVHVGWILGWVSVVLTGGALGVAAVSGGNAFVNAKEASLLMRKARENSFSQVLMEPLVTNLHGRAVTYGTVANISYGVAGATALGATGFFLWAFLATRSKNASTKASLQKTAPILAKNRLRRPTRTMPPFQVVGHQSFGSER